MILYHGVTLFDCRSNNEASVASTVPHGGREVENALSPRMNVASGASA